MKVIPDFSEELPVCKGGLVQWDRPGVEVRRTGFLTKLHHLRQSLSTSMSPSFTLVVQMVTRVKHMDVLLKQK